MRPSTVSLTSLALAAVAPLASAYQGTVPILAWSSESLAGLSTLSPSAPGNQPSSPFRQSKSNQAAFARPETDLCSLSSVILVSAPGLHYSDLALLPPTSSLAALQSAAADKVAFPYVDAKKAIKGGAVDRFVSRFVAECGARIERAGEGRAYEHASWGGAEEGGKRVRVEVVEGLEGWELTGRVAREGRREVVERVDSVLSTYLARAEGPFAVILTSLAHLPPASANKLARRQIEVEVESENDGFVSDAVAKTSDEFEQMEDFLEGFASSLWDEASTISSSAAAANGTSIFAVKPNSGLLHRYVFFTPGLILALLISFVLLIPLAIVGTKTLGTIQTVAGLEGKMLGGVGEQAGKGGN